MKRPAPVPPHVVTDQPVPADVFASMQHSKDGCPSFPVGTAGIPRWLVAEPLNSFMEETIVFRPSSNYLTSTQKRYFAFHRNER